MVPARCLGLPLPQESCSLGDATPRTLDVRRRHSRGSQGLPAIEVQVAASLVYSLRGVPQIGQACRAAIVLGLLVRSRDACRRAGCRKPDHARRCSSGPRHREANVATKVDNRLPSCCPWLVRHLHGLLRHAGQAWRQGDHGEHSCLFPSWIDCAHEEPHQKELIVHGHGSAYTQHLPRPCQRGGHRPPLLGRHEDEKVPGGRKVRRPFPVQGRHLESHIRRWEDANRGLPRGGTRGDFRVGLRAEKGHAQDASWNSRIATANDKTTAGRSWSQIGRQPAEVRRHTQD
mmetsp:Transcript_41551/g.89220  ORF Transcript_41551/g.89220 Transcript_41551/m.89220 type:complete len:288 (+) Transcript_41551:2277-3140(+)